MKLRKLGNNETEVVFANGDTVLVSYETPVAACIGGQYRRTDKRWSNTTSAHINNWLPCDAEVKPQAYFDGLLREPSEVA